MITNYLPKSKFERRVQEEVDRRMFERERELYNARRFEDIERQLMDLQRTVFELRQKVEGPVPVMTNNAGVIK